MQTRVAIIAIIVEDYDSVDTLNSVLHDYGTYIIGRMGLPYREKHINIISIAIDAPQDIISALSGKIGAERSGAELMKAIAALKKCVEYAQGNISPAAICGYLSWALR